MNFLLLAANPSTMSVSRLFYHKYGNGPKVLILFHGFGQDHTAFRQWLPLLETGHTVYAFDLYYHGESTRADKALTKQDWKKDFDQFLEYESIERFAIAAFSLGGRFALACAVLFPDRVEQLILLAPDGIYKNIWFRIATSRAGNPLFRYLMLHPDHFQKMLLLSERLRFAPSAMVRFAQKELQAKSNRKRVYRSWTYFKPLQCSIAEISRALNGHQIPLHLILGEKDHIIPAHKVLTKLKSATSVQVHMVPHRHHHIVEGTDSLVASLVKVNRQNNAPGI